jgi:hypothetical protein
LVFEAKKVTFFAQGLSQQDKQCFKPLWGAKNSSKPINFSDEEGSQADSQAALDEEIHDFLLSNIAIYGGYVISDKADEYIMDFCRS